MASFSATRLPIYSMLSIMIVTNIMTVNSVQAAVSHPRQDTAIRFGKGEISTVISGKLSSKQTERWYTFGAVKGQYAIINITPLTGTLETANIGVLYMPSGTQDGSKGGIVYQGCLPESGNYRLRIARNLMATHGKTAGYRAEVIILPKYASRDWCS